MNNPIVGLALALAIIVSVLALSTSYTKTHKQLPNDPVAQRIEALSTNSVDYNEVVLKIIEQAKKDTVIIYRDTCKSK
jgi:hypothetical protein